MDVGYKSLSIYPKSVNQRLEDLEEVLTNFKESYNSPNLISKVRDLSRKLHELEVELKEYKKDNNLLKRK